MSLGMKSGKTMPKTARFLASRSTPLWTKHPAAVRCRWNSSNSTKINNQFSGSKGKARGWSTWKVFSVAAATGILAHVLATNDAKLLRVKEREYSNPGKFSEPLYANFKDMEAVRFISS
jgi:hypothetical protein